MPLTAAAGSHREGLGQLEPDLLARRAGRTACPSRCGRGRPDSRTPAGSRGSAPRSGRRRGRCSSGAYHSRRTRCVQPLGERLGQPVGERLHGDRAVVVVLGLVARRRARRRRGSRRRTRRRGRRRARRSRRGSGSAGRRRGRLLAQEAEARAVDDDVVALGVRRPEAVDARAPAAEPSCRISRGAPARRRRARARPGARGSPGTCPSGPRRGRRTASRCTATSSASAGSTSRVPANGGAGRSSKRRRGAVRPRRREREQRLADLLGVLVAQPLLQLAVLDVERRAPLRVEQRRDDVDDAARVEHVHGLVPYSGAILTAVCWRDVVAPPISSGSSSPRRSISRATSTIWSSDGVISPESPTTSTPLRLGGVEDRLRRHHHAEVDHLVVVAAEHDADDVLADVVHVAFDRREQRPCPAAPRAPSCSSSMNGCR